MQAGDVALKSRELQAPERDRMLPYYAYRGAETLVGLLPQRVSYWLGDRAADALLATVPSRFDGLRDNLRHVLPTIGHRPLEHLIRRNLRNLTHCWVDVMEMSSHRTDLPSRIDMTDLYHFEEAIALEEAIGALPGLARSLAGLADALTGRSGDGDAQRASDCRRRARSIAGRLGMTMLLESLTQPTDEWSLGRDGEDWLLEAGDEHVRLRDSHGLRYLRALLAAPGQELSALDLAAGGAGLVASGVGPIFDDAARSAYRHRLAELSDELDVADRIQDSQRSESAETERQAVLRELGTASRLGGRTRETSADAERARVNVTRTLRATVDRIAATAPRTGSHLRASIRTGQACRYQPAPGGPNRWHV